VVRRRALLAGGALLLAGCGKKEAEVPPPRPVTALLRQLAAEHALFGALLGLRPRDELIRRLTARSRERTRRLATAIAAERARLYDAPLREEPTDDPQVALERARAALAAHVAALPDLAGPDRRRLGADLIAESAADLALLGARYGEPAADPFPGTTA
jgi:hypothetical protein